MKLIVHPDAAGIVSQHGQILGQQLPDKAVMAEFTGDSLVLPPHMAARLVNGAVELIDNFMGSGPWYDQNATLEERETPFEITALGIVPPNSLGRAVTPGWEHMAMQPRPLTKAEEKAREKAEADARAKADADALAALEITSVQARLAANDMGIRDDIEAVMADAGTPRAVKDLWEYSATFKRSHPLWEQFAPLIGKTSADIDAFFQLAKTK